MEFASKETQGGLVAALKMMKKIGQTTPIVLGRILDFADLRAGYLTR